LRVVDWQCPILGERPAKNEEVWDFNGKETEGDITNDNLDE